MTLFSKSRYLAGCQCPRRLWLGCFAPELGAEADASLAIRFDLGREIGRHAHALFPGGVLVTEEPGQHAAAVARTRALLADPAVPAIFEAAFQHEDVRIRVDVLERLGDGTWGLREVKSGTSVKDVYLDDLAVQRFVLDGCGLRTWSAELIHVNRDYLRGEAGLDWRQFFTRVELATEVAMRLGDVPARLAAMRTVLAEPVMPAIEPSPHCHAPHGCEFWAYCTREKPDDWILHLPRLDAFCFAALRAAGADRIVEIPDNFALTALQERARDVCRSGKGFVSPDLLGALDGSGPPADYLDFETINPPLPLYPGTRPYEQIPVQWSLHRADGTGAVEHRDFLADGRTDPRRAFVESLLAELGTGDGPVVVYSSFERRILDALGRAFPEHAASLGRLTSRLVDLLPIVRQHLYDARFAGSFSLKGVAPALIAGFGYDDLDGVSDGGEASAALLQLAMGPPGEPEHEERVRRALRVYCARDTEALVRLHRRLRELGVNRAGPDDVR